MSTRQKNRRGISLLLLSAFLFSNPAFAGEGTAGDYFRQLGLQLVHGFVNIVTSPAEIPCTMAADIKDKGAGVGIFTGFGMGTVYMLRRILVGAAEVGTFMLPRQTTIPPVCSSAAVGV